jgi:hypothetical protein
MVFLSPRSVVLKLESASEFPGGLVETQILRPRVSDPVGSRMELKNLHL